MQRNRLLAIALAWLPGVAALAGGTTSMSSTQQVFRVHLAATCRSFDSTQGRIVLSRLTDQDIIAQALGGGGAGGSVTQGFALAYNAAEDSLQVVNSNLAPVVDVIHFGGGAAITDSRQIDRFTFLFFPGQTNEFGAETNVFGSALITERANFSGKHNATPNIFGQLQFALTGGMVLGAATTPGASTNSPGMTNGVTSTNGNGIGGFPGPGFVMTSTNINFDPTATVCVGSFSTLAHAVKVPKFPVIPTGTNGIGLTNIMGLTNRPTGGLGTNGAANTGTTNGTAAVTHPGTSTVIGFNPVTGMPISAGTGTIGSGSPGSVPGTAGISGTTGIGTAGANTAITSNVTGLATFPPATGTGGVMAMVNTRPAGTPGSTTFATVR